MNRKFYSDLFLKVLITIYRPAKVENQIRNLTIPDYLFSEIEQLTQQELMTLAKVPSDTGDNSQKILR